MTTKTLPHGAGADWITGAAGSTRWSAPPGRNGANQVASAASTLATAKVVLCHGIFLSSFGGAGTIAVCDDAGTVIPGLTMTIAAGTPLGWYPFNGDGAIVRSASASGGGLANVGIKSSGAGAPVGQLYYTVLA